jgi:hypothetical protein
MTDEIQGGPGRRVLMSVKRRRRSAFPPGAVVGLFVIIVLAVGGGWLWLRSRGGPEPVPAAVTDSVMPVPEEPFVLPALGASDEVVRRLLAAVSAHPRLAAWLVTDDLVRRFVTAVVDISRGSTPVPALEMLIPEELFSVQASGDRLFMDPASQRRYDLLGEVFASADAEAAAEVYRLLLPLFREAYEELGVPDGEFEEVLARAVGNLLVVEVPEGPLEVREAVDRYTYVDERIQSLTPAEKHLVRLGPENARRVQEKLREISEMIGLTSGGEM